MKSVLITPEGIQKNLKSIKPLDAICEYIWNGFDAEATEISVKLHENNLGLINMITICDNGIGINYDELRFKFQPFNDSKKASMSSKTNHSLPHGRKGIGRLTFFAFSQTARWDTVYEKEGKKYGYYIEMNKDSLNQYDDNGDEKPHEVQEATGTKVTFTQLESLEKKDIIQKIKEEFFWFLELNRENKYKILVDEIPIDYSEFILDKQNIYVSDFGCEKNYDIRFVQWSVKLGNEYSRIYYLDSENNEKYKETTKLNKRADQFFHSVYIKSDYFNEFHFTNDEIDGQRDIFSNRSEDEYKCLLEGVNEFLIKYRREYLKKASDNYIAKLIDENIYPEFDTASVVGVFQKQELDNLVGTLYAAQPKIFTGLSDDNKKITLQLLKLIMDNGNKPELFKILQGIVELDEDEMKELSGILQYTSLSNITRTIKLLCDRQKVIQALKEVIFNKEFNSYEVPHVQKIIENHYWIFGEQYNLITAAEPDFDLALKGMIKATVGVDEDVHIDHPDKNKEMDIYMLRQDRHGKVTENVVIELKRPKIKLGEKEVSQVKKYMRVIKSTPRFNAGNVKWTFYLVGNEFDANGYIEGELESHKSHGEEHLIHCQDSGFTKIYALKWSEIFDDYSKRHNFLMERLKLEEELWMKTHKSADEAVKSIEVNSATLKSAVIPKSQADIK